MELGEDSNLSEGYIALFENIMKERGRVGGHFFTLSGISIEPLIPFYFNSDYCAYTGWLVGQSQARDLIRDKLGPEEVLQV